MTKKEIIKELLIDNQPQPEKATEHIDEMEIFKQKVDEQIERLHNAQMQALGRGQDLEELHADETEIESESESESESETETEV